MICLVLGHQNSGKSKLAERLAMETGDPKRYYLATMKICDEEGKKRVAKHRAMREGKDFVTIEKEYGILEVTSLIESPDEATVLLECVSNLVGNELYEDPSRPRTLLSDETGEAFCEGFAGKIVSEIRSLSERVHHLILVSNSYPREAPGYDEQTRLYIHLLDLVNQQLIPIADRVYDLRSDEIEYEKG